MVVFHNINSNSFNPEHGRSFHFLVSSLTFSFRVLKILFRGLSFPFLGLFKSLEVKMLALLLRYICMFDCLDIHMDSNSA